MSRSKRFIAGTIAGYGSIGANVLFTLLSVPLALIYLDKEQFGLWALAVQINGYLSLVELGMGNAILRCIADHKDKVNGGEYGSHLLTGGLVFILQGLLIASLGLLFSCFAPYLFSIPGHLAENFRFLLILLSGFSGLSVASRSLGSPLWAFQRIDMVNICFTLGTILSLAGLWMGFKLGYGIIAFPLAQIPAAILTPLLYVTVCKKNSYYPKNEYWSKPSWNIFIEIFKHGRDVFLIQVGNQLLNASQIIIISRFIGLGAAATYAVGTKLYTMGIMLLSNPVSSATPGLTEIYVNDDYKRFVTRYWDLSKITLAASAIIAVGIVTGNSSFVSIWTNDVIKWSWTCDALLGALIIVKTFTTGLSNLFSIAKNWERIRYLSITESLVYVPLAILLAKKFGVEGVLAGSLLAHLIITTPLTCKFSTHIIGSIHQIKIPILISVSMTLAALSVTTINVYLNTLPYITLITSFGCILVSIITAWMKIVDERTKIEFKKRILKI
jgi:O-antigen/teichoic acid export membrane protein